MDSGGAIASGVIMAPDRATAMRLLQGQGLLPMQLEASDTDVIQKPSFAQRAAPGEAGASGTDPIAYV